MNQSKAQTLGLIGVVLTVVCVILLYIVLSGPNVYYEPQTTAITQSSSNVETNSYSGVVNINTCTPAELEGIEGVGAKRAKLIVAYREKIGGYSSVEQIKDIYGIGEGLYAQIAPYLTV